METRRSCSKCLALISLVSQMLLSHASVRLALQHLPPLPSHAVRWCRAVEVASGLERARAATIASSHSATIACSRASRKEEETSAAVEARLRLRRRRAQEAKERERVRARRHAAAVAVACRSVDSSLDSALSEGGREADAQQMREE